MNDHGPFPVKATESVAEDPAQIVVLPLIAAVGAFTATTILQVVEHPLRVTVLVSVNVPVAPAVTVTDGPVDGPVITPFPVIVQLYVTVPAAGNNVVV